MPLPQDQDARMYYRVAKQRLDEATLILEKLNLYAASHYLAGYAVECILKALLIVQTPAGQRPFPGVETVD
jgi:HEPN domain-containing protein